MKVSAQSGAFRSSISLMSLYWELQALSAESMASIFSTATACTEKDLCQLRIKLGDDEIAYAGYRMKWNLTSNSNSEEQPNVV